MDNLPADLKACIQLCWDCRHTCQTTLYNHCLVMGGAHAERDHVTLMSDCIQACQTAADAMVRRSPVHGALCVACAEVCDACARSCAAIPGAEMQACADACRRCADSCRAMGAMKHAA